MILVKVKVFVSSGREEVIKKSENSLEIRVREKPVAGAANARVAALVALTFGVFPKKVRLVKGSRERNKIFKVL